MGGGKTSTGSSTVSIPPEVLARYNAVNTQAQSAANTPFQPYSYNPNAFVAPLTATQQAGIANTNTAAGAAQPFYQVAANQTMASGQPISGQQIGQYMSPFLGSVVGSESALLNQNNQQAMAGQLGDAIKSGAFGGDRSGVAAANLAQQQNLANANIYSGLLNQGYNTALQTAQQQQGVGLSAAQQMAGLGTEAQSAALQGAQGQLAAGQAEQQTGQAGLTALYNQFLQQQSYPFQTAQFLANIAEGTGALSGSTTTAQQPGGFFSDERLKEDIEPVGMTFDGQKIYKYRYKGDPKTQIGLLAQDVEHRHPHAVGLAAGYKTVDYDKATEHAAERGHFAGGGYAGGPSAYMDPNLVSPFDMAGILQAQEASFAPFSQSGRGLSGLPGGGAGYVPQANLAVGHLATAAAPEQRQSGLAAAASAANQMKGLYTSGRSALVGDEATKDSSADSGLIGTGGHEGGGWFQDAENYAKGVAAGFDPKSNQSTAPTTDPNSPSIQGAQETDASGNPLKARGGNVVAFPRSGLAAHRRHRDDGGANGSMLPDDIKREKDGSLVTPGGGVDSVSGLAAAPTPAVVPAPSETPEVSQPMAKPSSAPPQTNTSASRDIPTNDAKPAPLGVANAPKPTNNFDATMTSLHDMESLIPMVGGSSEAGSSSSLSLRTGGFINGRYHRDAGGAMPYQPGAPAGLDIPNDNPQASLNKSNAPGAGQSGLGQLAGVAGAGKELFGDAKGVGSFLGLGSMFGLATGGTADRKGYSGENGSSTLNDSNAPINPDTGNPYGYPDALKFGSNLLSGLGGFGSDLLSGLEQDNAEFINKPIYAGLGAAWNTGKDLFETPSRIAEVPSADETVPKAQSYPEATPPATLFLPDVPIYKYKMGPFPGFYAGMRTMSSGPAAGTQSPTDTSSIDDAAQPHPLTSDSTPNATGVAAPATGVAAPATGVPSTKISDGSYPGNPFSYNNGYPVPGASASISPDIANMKQPYVAPGAGDNVGLGSIKQPPESFASKIGDIAGGLGHWMTQKQNAIPLLEFLGAMGTAPTRNLGVALASGALGAASGMANQQQVGLKQQELGIDTAGNVNQSLQQIQAHLPQGVIAVLDSNGNIPLANGQKASIVYAYNGQKVSNTSAPGPSNVSAGQSIPAISSSFQNGRYSASIAPGGNTDSNMSALGITPVDPKQPFNPSVIQKRMDPSFVSQEDADAKTAQNRIDEDTQSNVGNIHQNLLSFSKAIAAIPQSGVATSGAGAEARYVAINAYNTARKFLGFGSDPDAENLTDANQIAEKMRTFLAGQQENQLGQHSLGMAKNLFEVLPSIESNPGSAGEILANLVTQNQKERDFMQYAPQYNSKYKTYYGINSNFENEFGPTYLKDAKVLSKQLMDPNSPIYKAGKDDWADKMDKGYVNNGKKFPGFGLGFSRYGR